MEEIMYQRVTFRDFVDAFRAHGRENQFSLDALEALFDHLEDLELELDSPIELDVVALCCDYQESSVDEIIDHYGLDASKCEDDDDRHKLVEDFLSERTNVIWWDDEKFLFEQF